MFFEKVQVTERSIMVFLVTIFKGSTVTNKE